MEKTKDHEENEGIDGFFDYVHSYCQDEEGQWLDNDLPVECSVAG
jgi:hypothetical protein